MALVSWSANDLSVDPVPGIVMAPGDVRVLTFDATRAFTSHEVLLREYGSNVALPDPSSAPSAGNTVTVTVGPLTEDTTYILMVSFADSAEVWSGTLVIECRVE